MKQRERFIATVCLFAVSSLLLGSQTVRSEWSYTIDFESNQSDGTVPADGALIENTGYTSTGYVTARFWTSFDSSDGNTEASLQSRFPLDGVGGTADHWYLKPSGGFDFASGYESQAGNWVARNWRFSSVNVMTLQKGALADFIDRVTGQIWDIDQDDGVEKFNVYAHDANGVKIASATSPVGIAAGSPGSLDGKPWTFELQVANDGSQDIAYVSIFRAGQNDQTGLIQNYDYDATYASAVANQDYQIGQSFWIDNLTISQTPEPNSLFVLGGLVSFTVLRRRRRRGLIG